MSIKDMLSAVGLGGIFAYYMVPSLSIVLLIYVIRQHKIRKKLRKKRKEDLKKLKEKQIEAINILQNDESALSCLADIPDQPENDYNFNSLYLEFDELGRIKIPKNKK